MSWSAKRVFKSTGVSVVTEDWDKKKGDIKTGADNAQAISMYLSNIKNSISEFHFDNLRNSVLVSRVDMRKQIDMIIQNAKHSGGSNKTFFDYYKTYLTARENSNKYKAKTNDNQQSAYNIIKYFAEDTGEKISFDSIDEDFKDRLLNYLYNQRGNSNNTARAEIKLFKTFLNYAVKQNWTKNTAFKSFAVSAKDSGLIALDADEILKPERLEGLTGSKEIVRKLFLIQIYTGLRLSDIQNLSNANFDFKKKEIKIYTIKTESYLIIPIHEKLEELLLSFPNQNFKVYNKTNYNAYIKNICESAAIDTIIQKTKYSGNQNFNEQLPKYKVISSHTARRTFITLLLSKSISPEDIMKITGHTSWSSFQKYIKNPRARAVSAAWDEEL